MPSLRLSDEDRERLGCPELLPFNPRDITNREIIQIGRLGYRTPAVFRRALSKLGDELDVGAWTAAVWLALRRAGVDTDINELEFNADQLSYAPDPEPEEPPVDEGKAPARAPSKSSATSSTRGGTLRARSRSRSSAS